MIKRRTYAQKKKWCNHWIQGDLSYMLRPHGQTDLHSFIADRRKENPKSAEPFVVETHRRLGKSFELILLGIEVDLKKPGAISKIGAPTKEMCFNIVIPNLDDLLADCPPEFQPKKIGDKWHFRNPLWWKKNPSLPEKTTSILQIVGCDYKNGNLLRGSGADYIALDEVGYITNVEYIIKSVIAPQFDRTDTPLFIVSSTPPPAMDHYFVCTGGLVEQGVKSGRHIVIRGSDNEDFNESEKRKYLEASNVTENSNEYRREIECEHITDSTRAIVPEFSKVKDEICVEWKRPDYFIPWTCMDTAYSDYVAALMFYIDFRKQLLIFEDMLWTHYATLGEIVRKVKKKQFAMWNDGPPVYGDPMLTGVRQIADCTELELESLNRDFNIRDEGGAWPTDAEEWEKQDINFMPVDRYDRDAAIAYFRTAVQQKKIRINPENCEPLIYQLQNGLWNDSRTHFKRSKQMGHCDALMAAVYANRMVLWEENPYPDASYNAFETFSAEPPDESEDTILEIYGLGAS